MKGDFSRDTFNLKKNFSRVLMQQGRVLLDADWNEQSAILLHYMQTLAADLIGQHGGPGDSFSIAFDDKDNPKDLTISAGHYYVDGILCENDETLNDKPVSYFNQPNYHADGDKLLEPPFLIYLDVWERHITCFEDQSLCEVALGGIDTTTRSQVVWQVKLRPLSTGETKCGNITFPSKSNALLFACTVQAQSSDDPCNIEPDARYRGAENQLYRVEINTGNVDENNADTLVQPTFKWSRENGSVVFPVINITSSDDTTKVVLANLGRDGKFGLDEGDWVELVDDAYTLQNRAGKLLQIVSIDRDEMSVTLNGKFPVSENPTNHLLLRRWDQKAGNPQEGGLTLNVKEGGAAETGNAEDNAAKIVEGKWLMLEDGIQIWFEDSTGKIQVYRTGDYWLIPARTATGDVEWTKDAEDKPIPQSPRGIEHHFAPLGIAAANGSLTPCHCKFVSECP